ncbi:MAG: hypothetical protein ACK42D_03735 [Candidatus Paceibacteria bacterium]
MTDVQKEEGKKTIVSFVVGLLIGGILVWAFTGGENIDAPTTQDQPNAEAPANNEVDEELDEERETETAPVTNDLPRGDGSVTVEDQPASTRVAMVSASYPISEGWIGVRDYNNGNLGGILGVVRFSESQGLVPKDIILQRPTRAGNTYAVVIFTENGDRVFNSATDVQLPTIFATFKAE